MKWSTGAGKWLPWIVQCLKWIKETSKTHRRCARKRSNVSISSPGKIWIWPKDSVICWSNTSATPQSSPPGAECKIYPTTKESGVMGIGVMGYWGGGLVGDVG